MMDPLVSSLKKRERRDGSTFKKPLVLSGNEDSCKEQAKGVSQAESLDNRDEHITTCGVSQAENCNNEMFQPSGLHDCQTPLPIHVCIPPLSFNTVFMFLFVCPFFFSNHFSDGC